MKIFLSCLALVALGLSSFNVTGDSLIPKKLVAIEVSHTHSHDHSSGHIHTHHQAPEHKENSPESQNEETHTHSFVVAVNLAIALPQQLVILFELDQRALTLFGKKATPPDDCSLGSVFRPPILA